MTTLAPGTWLAPDAAALVTAHESLLDDDAAARAFAAEVGRVRAQGRTPVVVLGPGADTTRAGVARRAELSRAATELADDEGAVWLTGRDPLGAARAAGGGDVGATLAALHHALLGHGAAAEALRDAGAGVVGTSVHLEVTRAADPGSVHDLAAAHEVDLVSNHLVLGPLLDGTYPVEARAATAPAPWDHVRPGDLVAIRRGLDVLLVEHAGTRTVRRAGGRSGAGGGAAAGGGAGIPADARGGGPSAPAAVVRRSDAPGADDVELVHTAETPGGRSVDAGGLYEVLTALDNAYLGTPLLALVATGTGEVGDGDGLAAHESAARRAAEDGADVRGIVTVVR
ncbi:family 1 glycosylhydrolase [Georgenia sp. Z1344]|uniref:family 1 glycosylhydrolase n=1 Tax=Georgenia sp. Z1344 TaxID=3416706 RepID=UPI003CEA99F7